MAQHQNASDRIVAITGGARGIGAATAAAFVNAGATVVIGDIDAEQARSTAEKLGPTAHGLALDVTDPVGVSEFLDHVEGQVGPIEVLINNAGIMPVVAFAEEPVASVQRQLAINVAGVIYGTQEGIRRMRPRGHGHIVNIASAAGKIGFPGVATYSATKFAVVGLTEAVALEYRDTGIEFSCVMPGLTNTELAAGLNDHWLLKTCQPEDISQAILAAVDRPRHRIYVPKHLAPLNAFYSALPHALGTRMMRLVGADHQILDGAGDARRAVYEARASVSAGEQRDDL